MGFLRSVDSSSTAVGQFDGCPHGRSVNPTMYSVLCSSGYGGGWGYSGHSVEALRFSVDADIVLGGLGLFGGRGEYNAKIKVR